MTEMRILTVRQPWAWAIIHGGKDVENRVRNLAGDYRGPLAIHAAKADADNAPESLWLAHADHYRAGNDDKHAFGSVRGAIIGVVDLGSAHRAIACHGRTVVEEVSSNLVRGYHAPTCSSWAEATGWHLALWHPRPLRNPISFKGALGLRRLDQPTIDHIFEELA